MPSRRACLVLGFGLGALVMGPVRALVDQYFLGRAAIDPNA